MLTRMQFISICFCVLILFGKVSFGYQESTNRPSLVCNDLMVDIAIANLQFSSNTTAIDLQRSFGTLGGRATKLSLSFSLKSIIGQNPWRQEDPIYGEGTAYPIIVVDEPVQFRDSSMAGLEAFVRRLVRNSIRDGLDNIATFIHEECTPIEGSRSLRLGEVRPSVIYFPAKILGEFEYPYAIDITDEISEIFLEELTPEYLESL